MRLISRRDDETFAYGFRLGCLLKRGDTVCLFGELGAGKTAFTKGIASAFGISERDIASASFTIIAEHKGRLKGEVMPFYHIDLYRIEVPSELDDLGIEDCIGGSGIAVVEWAERMERIEGSVSVRFMITGSVEREIIIEGISEEAWNNMQDRKV